MENKYFILGLLEDQLGKGIGYKNDDYMFNCPFCKHKKPKLVINIVSGKYNCWTCHPPTKGKNPVNIFKKLNIDRSYIIELAKYFKDSSNIKIENENNQVFLPKEYISLKYKNDTIEFKQAITYLLKRGLSIEDIVKYNIGYCDSGKYKDRIIIPSYNEKFSLNYFIARSIYEDAFQKYDAPKCNRTEVIGFENTINWDVPIILCEGVFDAIAIKRNAIPLFGKTIPRSVMLKIATNKVKTIYLALDKDAIRESLDNAEQLMKLGKDVYLVNLEEKDPSSLGFNKMLELLQSSSQLTFEKLFKYKIGI
jgi:DNA primase